MKTAWVFPGGGSHAVYVAGVCKAVKELKIPKPHLIVASSGGGADAFFYLADQVETMCNIWANELSTKKIINVWRFWKVFGRDHMIDEVFNKKNNLNMEKVRKSKIKFYVGVTNAKTGKVKFFINKDKTNLWALLRATITVPILSGVVEKSVKIGKQKYMDSRASSRAELNIMKAISLGAEKIIVFGNRSTKKARYMGNFWFNVWLLWKILQTGSTKFMKNQKIAKKKQESFSEPKDIKIIYLGPGKKLEMPPWMNNQEDLRRFLKQGYKNTLKNKELKSFTRG